MTALTLPIQIAAGLTISVVGLCLAYQFGDWLNCLFGRHGWFFQANARINPHAHYFTYFRCVSCGTIKTSGLEYTVANPSPKDPT